MDNHTRSAQDLLPSGAHSYDSDELERETAAAVPAHAPERLRGHAEKDDEAASLPLGVGPEPEAGKPLAMPGEHQDEANEPLTIPGEHEDEASDASSPVAAVPAAKPSTRHLLLGTALALTLMLGGGGIYILSHRGSAPQMAAAAPPPWHPQQVTRNPADPVGVLVAHPLLLPLPPQHSEQAYNDTDDIMAARHPGNPQLVAAVPVPKAVAPAVVAPAAPVLVVPPPSVAAATPARPDPVATALALRPAAMTPQQQVDVVSLVTQMAALVRDVRTENAQLRDKVASLDTLVKNETLDVSQRLNLMEARKAIASAQDAGKPHAQAAPDTGTAAPAPVVRTVAVVPVPVAVRSVRDYRVQAASPGLAILADANAAPGQSAALQVAVGDLVPGVGRITSIGQRGTSWVVQTNHGSIQ